MRSFAILVVSLCSILAQAQKISDFVSVAPLEQSQLLQIPTTHTFQVLLQTGIALPDGSVVQVFPDFTGYISKTGSIEGHLAVNYEVVPGGVTVYDIALNPSASLWEINGSANINFLTLGGSGLNCSGGVTPWGTSITSEEAPAELNQLPDILTDINQDGYIDLGWNTEIDPVSKSIVDQNGDGSPDKIWAMGRIKHENVTVNANGTILYQGADDSNFGYLYKFVPDVAGKLVSGSLFVLKMNAGENNVYSDAGVWIPVPNKTPQECNAVNDFATTSGATNFNRIEDVEVGPNGFIYFAATGPGNIYRFQDLAGEVGGFQTWVKKGMYSLPHNAGIDSVLFEKCDNLVFDCDGNLWVTEDGTNFHIWVVDANHTPSSPQIRLFMTPPLSLNDPSGNISGAEPTGLTFTPDCRYGFMSLQRCGQTNTAMQTDATGNPVIFNRDATIVFARKEFLGSSTGISSAYYSGVSVYPNPVVSNVTVEFSLNHAEQLTLEIIDPINRKIVNKPFTGNSGENKISFDAHMFPSGTYILSITGKKGLVLSRKIVRP